MKEYVKIYSALSSLTDTSTTDDIAGLDPTALTLPTITNTITFKGKTYSDADTNSDETQTADAASSHTDTARDTELPSGSNMSSDVVTALTTLNSARLAKYNTLDMLDDTLSRNIEISDMSKLYHVIDK